MVKEPRLVHQKNCIHSVTTLSYKNQSIITQGHMNLLLKYFALCGLWVSKIHQLIQKFVDEDKVVSNALFLQLLEVLRENLHKAHTNTHTHRFTMTSSRMAVPPTQTHTPSVQGTSKPTNRLTLNVGPHHIAKVFGRGEICTKEGGYLI